MTSADDTGHLPLRIGITGGIASGKSTVADIFAEHGVPVIDTDVIAREVVAPGSKGLERVVERFGPEVLTADGALDRRRMRERVFADEAEREALEELLHPLIWQQVQARSEALTGTAYCVVVVPLLAETEAASRLDRVLVVDCDEDQQIERLMARDGESEEGARRILAAQATRTGRLAVADDVIINSGDRAALAQQVARLHAMYSGLAR